MLDCQAKARKAVWKSVVQGNLITVLALIF